MCDHQALLLLHSVHEAAVLVAMLQMWRLCFSNTLAQHIVR
jgi:hypothetical protein